jgi:hypothetical protein
MRGRQLEIRIGLIVMESVIKSRLLATTTTMVLTGAHLFHIRMIALPSITSFYSNCLSSFEREITDGKLICYFLS